MSNRPIRLLGDSYPETPAFDTAVSRAILERASAGLVPETIRLHRPGDTVAFGRQDVVSPGYRRAVQAARAGGFEAVERLAGGRAAVYHRNTIALSWCVPDTVPRERIRDRFAAFSEVVLKALRRLGVDARMGEVPGEYCPGTYSVNARGRTKLMGVGQRLMRGAAHVGGVLVVADGYRVRDILLPVYRELELGWDPATVGSIEDEIGSAGYEEVEEALLIELSSGYDLVSGTLDYDTLDLAEQLETEHRSPG